MEQLTISEVLKATGGNIERPQTTGWHGDRPTQTRFSGISTDSRTVKNGDLFFAVKGQHHDGHRFIGDAIDSGAMGVVAENGFDVAALADRPPQDECCFIHVADTIKALGYLAKYYRKKMPAKIVAVTGSNGKTTTKDMVYHLLSRRYKGVKSRASYNNFIGVPLTIFDLDSHCRFGVVEMGTNAFGEISWLSEIAAPDIAVITNIAETHLEGLRDIAGVKRAKAEVLDNLGSGGVLLTNADDRYAAEIGDSFDGYRLGFGVDKNADVRGSEIIRTHRGWSFTINKRHRINLPIDGYYNIVNCLAAFAVIVALGEWIDECDNIFEDFRLPSMRMDRETVVISGGAHDYHDMGAGAAPAGAVQVTIINDAYNANPSSMKAAINDFNMMQCGGRKIFVCGEMSELGAQSRRLHTGVGKEIGRSSIDILWAVGPMADIVGDSALDSGMWAENVSCFETVDELINAALPRFIDGDTLLLKGSRSMRLERLVAAIRAFVPFNLQLSMG